jgi:flagellar hook-associated protein 2
MPTAQISGLASGIDWQETIELIMQIESQPVVLLEGKKDNYELKLESWQSINSSLLSLKTTMMGMDDLNEMLTKAANSTNTSIATATANSAAATGSYTLEINQLAQSDIWTHDGWADENTTAVNSTGSDQTFEYSIDGTTYTVTVPDGATLAELAELINDDVNNPGVSATILNDGSGLATAYHLQLTGQTGADNSITIEDGTLNDFDNDNFGTGPTQAAQNAQFRINSYPTTTWIESSSNEVTGAISGVTLHLHSTNPGDTINITITNDNSAVKDKIQEFVDAYNEAVSLINAKTHYDEENEIAGPLFGDSRANGIRSDLQSIIAAYIPGLDDDARYASLGEIGIEFDSEGLLTIDDAKLTDALEEDFTSVGELFSKTYSSDSNNLTYFYSTEQTQGGIYNVIANYDTSGNLTSATINGHTASIEGNYIIGAEGQPEAGLRIEFTDPGGGAGSVSAEIRLGTGAAVQVANRVEFLTDAVDGTITVAEDGIEDAIESIERQIERWEKRLATKQEQLEQQFLAMEILVGQMQSTGNYLSAMMSGL